MSSRSYGDKAYVVIARIRRRLITLRIRTDWLCIWLHSEELAETDDVVFILQFGSFLGPIE